MVKVSADGTVQSVFEQFGTKTSSFNPVYDEAPDISTRIDEDSTAPFASGGMFERHSASAEVHRHNDREACCDHDAGDEDLAGL